MVAELTEGGVPFYEGCLIVEVHDHKLVAAEKEQEARPSSRSKRDIPSSIHKYSPFVTPSPSRPFPQDAGLNGHNKKPHVDQREKPAGSADQGSPSASSSPQAPKSKAPPKSTVYTAVLFPTHQSRQADLAVKACNPRGSVDSRQDGAGIGVPSTPSLAVPPTPTGSSMPPPSKKVKRERMELDSSNIYPAEGAMLLATLPPLDLEPTKDALGTIIKLEEQAAALDHRFNPPPKPKTRKRTVAEMAADEAQAAENERFLLILDERSGQGGSSVPGGDGQQQAAPFEPSFDRFKKIEDIKREHAERAKQEKIKAAEKERQLHETKLQQQAQQQAALQQQQAEEARNRQEQAARAQQEELNRRKQHQLQQQQRLQAQAAAQAQAAQAQQFANMSQNASHGHPPLQNGQVPVSAPMAHARLQGGVSQPAASSPMVRQSTPQNNMSSPMVGGVPMQPSGSSVGVGSPARPPSVVNQPVPMSVSMSARGSQQSHQSGTPRIPQGTPNMAHATPMSRPQMSNNPPPPNMQMSPAQLHNTNLAMQHVQLAAAQQRQRHFMQQNGMMPQNPQQMQQMQMQQNFIRQQQARMQMANGGQQPNQAMMQQYRAQMIQAQRAAQAQGQGGQYANQQGQSPNHAQLQQMQFAAAAAAAAQQQAQQQAAQQQQNPQAAIMAQQHQLEAAQRLAQGGGGHPAAQAQAAQMQAAQQQLARAVQAQAAHFYRNGLANWLSNRGLTQETALPQDLHQFRQQCMANAQSVIVQRRQQATGAQTGFNMGHGFGQ